MKGRLVRDQSGASTELGYIFTFLLGVLFLSMFSVWAFGLETSTRENWNTTAVVSTWRISLLLLKEQTWLVVKIAVFVMQKLSVGV